MTTPTLMAKATTVAIPPETRTLAYLRVSTEDQARGDAVSLKDQLAAAQRFAAERRRTLDAVVEDRESGRRLTRRGFQALIAHCERYPRRGEDRGLVICLDNSRWGRFVTRPSLGQTFIDRLFLAGWDVQFTREPSTGNEDADVFLGAARSVASATESRRISYRAKTGMVAQARAGHWQGRPPFGFDRVATSSATGRARTLAPYERSGGGERVTLIPGPTQDVRTVRRLFQWAAKGLTLEEIARRLNREAVPGPWNRYGNNWRSGRAAEWTMHNIKAILTNPAYVGDLCFARRTPSDGHGRRRRLPREEWVIVEGAWEALVDRKIWARVQAIFAGRKGQRRPRVVQYLLTGLMHCTRCGSLLQGGGGTRPKAPDPLRFTYYKCPQCSKPRLTVNRPWLERQVIGLVSAHVNEVVEDGSFDRVLDEVVAAQRSQERDGRRDRERELARLRQQRDRLVAAVADGTLRKDEAGSALDSLREKLEQLEAEQHQSRFDARGQMVTARDRTRLKAMARAFPEQIARANVATARELLGYWIAGLYLDHRQRTGRLSLRKVPVPSLANQSTARQGRARRCWRGACPPSCRT